MGSLIGSRLGHFRVERLLGAGGVGAVYAAVDEKLERPVAVKVLLEGGDSPVARKRFLREARLAAKVTHPNIATVYEVGEFEEGLYIVMELLEGKSLRKYLAARRPEAAEALSLARDVARALAKAHASSIVHRDIKPENVFVSLLGEGVQAKVLDFGLARQETSRKTLTPAEEEQASTETTVAGDIAGTPGYWSPEQARAQPVDCRTDVFSFGLVFYEMLTGRRAFSSNSTVQLVLAAARHDPTPLRELVPNIAPEIEAIVNRCLEKSPGARFADGAELLSALDAVARAGRVSSPELDVMPLSPAPAAPPRPPSDPRIDSFDPPLLVAKSQPTPGPTSLDGPRLSAWRGLASRRDFPFMAIVSAAAGVVLALVLVVIVALSRGGKANDVATTTTSGPLAGDVAREQLEPAVAVSLPVEPGVAATVENPGAVEALPPDEAREPSAEAPRVEAPGGDVDASVSLVGAPLVVAPPGGGTPTPVVGPSPSAAGVGTASGSRPSRRKPDDCAEPFTRDEKGVKIPKLHCL